MYAQIVQEIIYFPKHKLGISKENNRHMHPDPFHGVGQGSGNGGTQWGFVTEKIIKVYDNTCHLAIIYSPLTSKWFKEQAHLFVDNTS